MTEPLGIRGLQCAPEISAEDMVTLQAEDEELAPVIQWLQEDTSPTLEELRTYSNAIRSLWAQRADLQFRDEVLVRITPSAT